MKPLRLEFCGINSFSEPVSIDFTELLRYGIFGVFGDTGSGKSTILDCIGFALYGAVARSRTGSVADSINYKLDRANVAFEFEIVYEGRRRVFRVERELKRKNALQNVRVWERREGALAALSEGVRESNALLERIVGLGQRDFERCIALPQGEFAQFVKSTRADRVKLIARLFDLEQYGDALKDRAKEQYKVAREETELICARLEPYAAVTRESIRAARGMLEKLTEEDKAAKLALVSARERERTLGELARFAKERERVRVRYEALAEKRGEMDGLAGELTRLGAANAVLSAYREGAAARETLRREKGAYDEASAARERARAGLDALASWNAEEADAEIDRLSDLLLRAGNAEQYARRKAERDAALARVSAEFSEEKGQFAGFSYEEEKRALEERLRSLGEGDYFAYLEECGKAALLKEEYETFRGELEELVRRHPGIAEDADPLIEKYARLAAKSEGKDLHRAFEAREREREETRRALVDLEAYRGKYQLHLQRMQQLQTEFRNLKEEEAREAGQTVSVGVTVKEAEALLAQKRAERRETAERLNRAKEAFNRAELGATAAETRFHAAEAAYEGAKARYRAALGAGGIADAEEARSLAEKYGDASEARERLETYRSEFAAVSARYAELSERDCSEATEEAVAQAQTLLSEAEARAEEITKQLALCGEQLARGERDYEKKTELERALLAKRKEADLAERLKKLLDGNKFMEFVAEECLQNIAASASERLLKLTGGRYFLRYEEGFSVGDNFNAGNTRAVYTLSGGETFLVSLSLALALSSEICAKSLRPIEFFFLDEGFGTLDEHLVDTVLDSLEKLKNEHFSIGIISHVEELKHRIDKKLLVKKATEKHGSQIQAE